MFAALPQLQCNSNRLDTYVDDMYVYDTKNMLNFCSLSLGVFTGQVCFMRHNRTATGVLLTHVPNKFQTS